MSLNIKITNDKDETITIDPNKFLIDDNQNMKIITLKHLICIDRTISSTSKIHLKYDNKTLDDNKTLSECGIKTNNDLSNIQITIEQNENKQCYVLNDDIKNTLNNIKTQIKSLEDSMTVVKKNGDS